MQQIVEIEIVYEDSVLLVAHKPAGLATQTGQSKHQSSLYTLLKKQLHKREGKEIYLALHHRIDAATAGLVLFCKNKHYNKFITDLFRNKKIKKSYIAIVDKNIDHIQAKWRVENKLKSYQVKHFKKAKSAETGDEAITDFILLKESAKRAMIECMPQTGRLHQIRVHLSEMGLPIVGDFHYNKRKSNEQLLLYAYKLAFRHPKTKEILSVEFPINFEDKLNE